MVIFRAAVTFQRSWEPAGLYWWSFGGYAESHVITVNERLRENKSVGIESFT